MNLTEIRTLDEFEGLSRTSMTEMAYEYVNAGVAGDLTLRDNLFAFDRIRLMPRVLADVSHIDTSVSLFGRRHAFPILLAPCAYHKLVHEEGEIEAARGAALSEATLVAASFATVTVEDTAEVTNSPLWFQLYVHPDREFTEELVKRAESAGCEVLVLTADVPVNGPRDRELRAGFALPPGVIRANLSQLGEQAAAAHRPSGRNIFSPVRAPDLTYKDIGWLKSITRMPLIVKGILHPDDARVAIEAGADGIYVSNHGGRSVDTVPSALEVLPEIRAKVGWAIPLLLDGGIRRGTDVVKALALGANAVLIGRPYLYGLAVGGAAGVARVVEILRTELEMAMGLTGKTTIAAIDGSLLWPRPALP
jgi:4-hydroxymandelate oxidase